MKNASSAIEGRRRAEIEKLISRYPALEPWELGEVKSYFMNEASAMDSALIASNEEIRPQYRRFRSDHFQDRLRPWELALCVVFASALCSVIVWVALR